MRVNVCKKIDEGIKTTLDVVLEDKTINLECEGIVVGGVTNDHARLVNLITSIADTLVLLVRNN